MTRRRTRIARALAAAALLISLSAGSVLAGEITGNGKQTPIKFGQANSICAFSGLNDDPAGLDPDNGPPGRVQSWGQDVKANGPMGGVPGMACRGNQSH